MTAVKENDFGSFDLLVDGVARANSTHPSLLEDLKELVDSGDVTFVSVD